MKTFNKQRIKDLLTSWESESSVDDPVKSKTVTLTLHADALALSVSAHRQNFQTDSNNPYHKIYWNSSAAYAGCTDTDFETAEQIREYYKQKWTWQALKQSEEYNTPTKYQQHHRNFIHSDGLCVDESIGGLIQTIPHFYEIDQTYDLLRQQTSDAVYQSEVDKMLTVGSIFPRETKTLTALRKVNVSSRWFKGTQYFHTDQNNCLVMLSCSNNNTLKPLLDYQFGLLSGMQIEGNWIVKQRDQGQFQYYSPLNWAVV